jgi:hypothetical protein
MKDVLVPVFAEEHVRIVHDQPQHRLTRRSRFEILLELELKVQLYGATTDARVLRAIAGVLKHELEPEALHIKLHGFAHVPGRQDRDHIVEFCAFGHAPTIARRRRRGNTQRRSAPGPKPPADGRCLRNRDNGPAAASRRAAPRRVRSPGRR